MLLCAILPPSTFSYNSYYVHIPFCRQRCKYCDFAIVPVASITAPPLIANPYVADVITEISKNSRLFPSDAPLRSLYFGGGTPSLLPPHQLIEILNTIKSHHELARDCEITIELDPGTFKATELATLATAGFNRISLGVQSFSSEILKTAGRSHSVEDVRLAVDTVKREPRIKSWSLDLISGLPGMSKDDWQGSLMAAVELQPPHISCYDLQVKRRTHKKRPRN